MVDRPQYLHSPVYNIHQNTLQMFFQLKKESGKITVKFTLIHDLFSKSRTILTGKECLICKKENKQIPELTEEVLNIQ